MKHYSYGPSLDASFNASTLSRVGRDVFLVKRTLRVDPSLVDGPYELVIGGPVLHKNGLKAIYTSLFKCTSWICGYRLDSWDHWERTSPKSCLDAWTGNSDEVWILGCSIVLKYHLKTTYFPISCVILNSGHLMGERLNPDPYL